jgi:hypothetical protein
MTGDEDGIQRWEKILSITPDLLRDTLEFRQSRNHRIYNTRPPFTVGRILYWLENDYGISPAVFSWDPVRLYLEMQILSDDGRIVIEIQRQSIQVIPANLNLQVRWQIPMPRVRPAIAGAWIKTHSMIIHTGRAMPFPERPLPERDNFIAAVWVEAHHVIISKGTPLMFPMPEIRTGISGMTNWFETNHILIHAGRAMPYPVIYRTPGLAAVLSNANHLTVNKGRAMPFPQI